ncbi:MAG: DUF1294 domain-containing protein [Anaerolineae bacterium]|nr:DUF1294 domain-containing protein [Anaerolineae bacterium]
MSEHRVCQDCGRSFTLSYEQQRWYRDRKLQLPKRCPECLSRRRADRQSGYKGFSGPPAGTPAPPRKTAPRATPSRSQAPNRRPTPSRSKPKTPSRPAVRSRRGQARWWQTPEARFALIAVSVIAAVAIAALLAGLPVWAVVLIAILAINVVTLVLYRYDKAISAGTWTRVPEIVLLALALLGGSPAAYVAIYTFRKRHKAKKLSFVATYWLIVVIQGIVLLMVLFWWLNQR